MTLEQQKEILSQALEKSDTPLKWFENVFEMAYQKGREDFRQEALKEIAAKSLLPDIQKNESTVNGLLGAYSIVYEMGENSET